jgi:hypothetical protein
MPARKLVDADASVETKVASVPSAAPGKTVRSLEVVANAIRERFSSGESAETILQDLQVSEHVFRELLTQSYQLVGRAPVIFEYQEKMRIGEIEA